jgi:hypothetical protein
VPRNWQGAGRNRLDLGFLDFDQAKDHSHIFLKTPSSPASAPETSSAPPPCST